MKFLFFFAIVVALSMSSVQAWHPFCKSKCYRTHRFYKTYCPDGCKVEACEGKRKRFHKIITFHGLSCNYPSPSPSPSPTSSPTPSPSSSPIPPPPTCENKCLRDIYWVKSNCDKTACKVKECSLHWKKGAICVPKKPCAEICFPNRHKAKKGCNKHKCVVSRCDGKYYGKYFHGFHCTERKW